VTDSATAHRALRAMVPARKQMRIGSSSQQQLLRRPDFPARLDQSYRRGLRHAQPRRNRCGDLETLWMDGPDGLAHPGLSTTRTTTHARDVPERGPRESASGTRAVQTATRANPESDPSDNVPAHRRHGGGGYIESSCGPPKHADQDPRNSSVTRRNRSGWVQISAWSAPSMMMS